MQVYHYPRTGRGWQYREQRPKNGEIGRVLDGQMHWIGRKGRRGGDGHYPDDTMLALVDREYVRNNGENATYIHFGFRWRFVGEADLPLEEVYLSL